MTPAQTVAADPADQVKAHLMLEVMIFTTMGAGLGFAAWGKDLAMLAFAPMLAWLWAHAPRRFTAAAAVFGYYLAAARGMPHGTAVFFGTGASQAYGYALWIGTAAALALPWLALWPANRAGYAWRLALALALVSVPPFGIFGWANPLTAAGALFPSTAWFGLILTFTIMLALCLRTALIYPAMLIVGIIVSTHVVDHVYREPQAPWRGKDTRLSGVGNGQIDFMQSFRNNQELMRSAINAPPHSVIVFPETVAGMWSNTTASLWQTEAVPTMAKKGITALIGASIPVSHGVYDNAMILVGENTRTLYVQRVPIPLSMWRPFSTEGARAHWYDNGIAYVDGKRVAMFLCYEQLLMWPAIVSLANQPHVIVAPSNAWWSAETSVPTLQTNTMRAWARLFDIPLITAFNY